MIITVCFVGKSKETLNLICENRNESGRNIRFIHLYRYDSKKEGIDNIIPVKRLKYIDYCYYINELLENKENVDCIYNIINMSNEDFDINRKNGLIDNFAKYTNVVVLRDVDDYIANIDAEDILDDIFNEVDKSIEKMQVKKEKNSKNVQEEKKMEKNNKNLSFMDIINEIEKDIQKKDYNKTYTDVNKLIKHNELIKQHISENKLDDIIRKTIYNCERKDDSNLESKTAHQNDSISKNNQTEKAPSYIKPIVNCESKTNDNKKTNIDITDNISSDFLSDKNFNKIINLINSKPKESNNKINLEDTEKEKLKKKVMYLEKENYKLQRQVYLMEKELFEIRNEKKNNVINDWNDFLNAFFV